MLILVGNEVFKGTVLLILEPSAAFPFPHHRARDQVDTGQGVLEDN